MSGQLHDLGAIISFTMVEGYRYQYPGRLVGMTEYPGKVVPVVALALVVTDRDHWVIDTEIRPVVLTVGGALAVVTPDAVGGALLAPNQAAQGEHR